MKIGDTVIINYSGFDWLVKINGFAIGGPTGPYKYPKSRMSAGSPDRAFDSIT